MNYVGREFTETKNILKYMIVLNAIFRYQYLIHIFRIIRVAQC